MLLKKICMIGSFAVGKTSLVRQSVQGCFSETYKTTVGVKIDNKVVRVGADEVTLVLWDLYGEDKFQTLLRSHLSGVFGYLLVADGTRMATLHEAEVLEAKMRQEIGAKPFVFLILSLIHICETLGDMFSELGLRLKGELELPEK